MARNVHIFCDTRRPCVWLLLLAAGAAATMAGCVLAPIEPEEPEDNLPPFIDPTSVQPPESVIQVTDASQDIRLSAQPLDPNFEESLDYVFISNRNNILRLPGTLEVVDQNELFTVYESAVVSFEPNCADAGATEVIRLYVSDGGLTVDEFTNAVAPAEEGRFLTSQTWVLEYSPNLCPTN